MDQDLHTRIAATLSHAEVWKPEFVRLDQPGGAARLRSLLDHPGVQVHDTIRSQVKELVRSLNPSIRYQPDELERAADAHVGATSWSTYGVWVFYPWSNRLVHLLDEAEFALVRTDRNRNKITREEQAVLASKLVGVIGLSVGQSIALTMALERSFGEIRLADFDTLDLSNLNRIRSGVHNLGLRKVVNVAREIMEIDPFLKVTCYPEGITRDNIGEFCTQGGKLDVLVDECDSVDVKIYARQTAKSLGIPVVMDTSDRGMIDVERFDLEPGRPILHGLIDHLDPLDAAKAKTNEEKLPFLAPIAALDNLSPRMKASMLDLGRDLVTWPQLASSVALGGAVAGELARWICLGQPIVSQRRYVDSEDIFKTKPVPPPTVLADNGEADHDPEALWVRCDALLRDLPAPSSSFSEEEAEELAKAGSLAPSAGNNQPWKFLLRSGLFAVAFDRFRGKSGLDTTDLIPMLGLGACVENIFTKAGAMGLELNCELFPLGESVPITAVLSKKAVGVARPAGNAEYLNMRRTTRRTTKSLPLSDGEVRAIRSSILNSEGIELHLVTDKQRLAAIGALCGSAERLRLLNPIGHTEFFKEELRWSPSEAERTRDGLDLRTLELNDVDATGLRIASDQAAIDLARRWKTGHGLRRSAEEQIPASLALGVITSSKVDRTGMIGAGRAIERVWLECTRLGLGVHPVSAPVFLSFEHRFGSASAWTGDLRDDLTRLDAQTREHFSDMSGEPLFLFRVLRGTGTSIRSLRLPLNEIFRVTRTKEPQWNE